MQGVRKDSIVWMSHGDRVTRAPEGFRVTAMTDSCPIAAIVNDEKQFYGVQFHPEVTHTKQGTGIFENFIRKICGLETMWNSASIIEDAIVKIREKVGSDFLKNLDEIGALKGMIDDELVGRFNCIKHQKKEQLCKIIAEKEGVQLNPDFIFDVQVKRLHEYKRQLMNAISIVDIYFRLKNGELPNFQPTAFIFGAKSAPG